MRKALLSILLVSAAGCVNSTVVSTSSTTTTLPPTTSTTDDRIDRWSEDLDAMFDAFDRRHPNPYWRFDKSEVEAAFQDVRTRLGGWSDDRITIEFIRLAAMFDGHSGVFLGDLPGWDFARIRFYLFDEGVGVVAAEDPALVGGRLVSIGDTPADQALDAVWTLSNSDNEVTRSSFAPHFLAVPRVLAGLGIIADTGEATYTIETVDGDLVTTTPETGTHGDYLAWFGPEVVGHAEDPRAMYLEDKWNPFWWRRLDDGAIYAQYNEVVGRAARPDGPDQSLAAFAIELAQVIDAEPGVRVVLDMRHNLGGNLATYGPLLNALIDRFDDACGLHVIVGRETFSAAMTFVVELEQRTTATFHGERTGGSPNLYGDAVATRLPNSGIPVAVSGRYWEIGGSKDDRLWLEPSVVITPTLDDWRAANDPALESALASEECIG